jgi:hypothetical protein
MSINYQKESSHLYKPPDLSSRKYYPGYLITENIRHTYPSVKEKVFLNEVKNIKALSLNS